MDVANNTQLQEPPQAPDPGVRANSMLSRIPTGVWNSLTAPQKAGIRAALTAQDSDHLLALRSSIALIGGRYYLAIFFGRERRSRARLRDEGQLEPIEISFAYIILAAIVGLYGIIPLILVIYIVKSVLGIDIMDGPSPLHALICN